MLKCIMRVRVWRCERHTNTTQKQRKKWHSLELPTITWTSHARYINFTNCASLHQPAFPHMLKYVMRVRAGRYKRHTYKKQKKKRGKKPIIFVVITDQDELVVLIKLWVRSFTSPHPWWRICTDHLNKLFVVRLVYLSCFYSTLLHLTA